MSDTSDWMKARRAYFRSNIGILRTEFTKFCAYAKLNYLRHKLAVIALGNASPNEWNALLNNLGTKPFTDAAFHADTPDQVRQFARCGVVNHWKLPTADAKSPNWETMPYYQQPLAPDLIRFNVRFAYKYPNLWHIDIKDNRIQSVEVDRLRFHASFVKDTAHNEYHITDTMNAGKHFFYNKNGVLVRTNTPIPKGFIARTSPVQVPSTFKSRTTCKADSSIIDDVSYPTLPNEYHLEPS